MPEDNPATPAVDLDAIERRIQIIDDKADLMGAYCLVADEGRTLIAELRELRQREQQLRIAVETSIEVLQWFQHHMHPDTYKGRLESLRAALQEPAP